MYISTLKILCGPSLSNHPCVLYQLETLETILGGPRKTSGFYPEPDSRAGKEVGNKHGSMPDSLHGKAIYLHWNILTTHNVQTDQAFW